MGGRGNRASLEAGKFEGAREALATHGSQDVWFQAQEEGHRHAWPREQWGHAAVGSCLGQGTSLIFITKGMGINRRDEGCWRMAGQPGGPQGQGLRQACGCSIKTWVLVPCTLGHQPAKMLAGNAIWGLLRPGRLKECPPGGPGQMARPPLPLPVGGAGPLMWAGNMPSAMLGVAPVDCLSSGPLGHVEAPASACPSMPLALTWPFQREPWPSLSACPVCQSHPAPQ